MPTSRQPVNIPTQRCGTVGSLAVYGRRRSLIRAGTRTRATAGLGSTPPCPLFPSSSLEPRTSWCVPALSRLSAPSMTADASHHYPLPRKFDCPSHRHSHPSRHYRPHLRSEPRDFVVSPSLFTYSLPLRLLLSWDRSLSLVVCLHRQRERRRSSRTPLCPLFSAVRGVELGISPGEPHPGRQPRTPDTVVSQQSEPTPNQGFTSTFTASRSSIAR
jgi:hypothetical protein